MPLSGSVTFATASGSTAWIRRLWLAASPALAGRLLLRPAGINLRLLAGRNLGRRLLQLRLARHQPRQPIRAASEPPAASSRPLGWNWRSSRPSSASASASIRAICRLDRCRGAVRIERGVGLHLGAVQRHQPQPDQAGVAAHLQHPHEHGLHPLDMAAAGSGRSPCGPARRADDEAIADIAPAQPLDRPARADAVAVGIDQHRQQHRRRERRLAGTAELVRGLEGGRGPSAPPHQRSDARCRPRAASPSCPAAARRSGDVQGNGSHGPCFASRWKPAENQPKPPNSSRNHTAPACRRHCGRQFEVARQIRTVR